MGGGGHGAAAHHCPCFELIAACDLKAAPQGFVSEVDWWNWVEHLVQKRSQRPHKGSRWSDGAGGVGWEGCTEVIDECPHSVSNEF